MSRYAEGTLVASDRSRAEIESTLARFGADRFGYMNDSKGATILFEANGKQIKFFLPLPSKESFATKFDGRSNCQKPVSPDAQFKAWEQACREKWRSLALMIKAKLVGVQDGIVSFESEFLAHIIIGPRGQTVADKIIPQIEDMRSTGKMPMLLLGSGTP